MYTRLTGSLEPQPTPKKVKLTIDSRKGSPDISRPVYIASNETIDDRRNYIDRTPSRRTIRTEDLDIRPRVLDDDAKGRLLDNEEELNFSQINKDAEKYARIGEKVITRLFKVQVPDMSDMEYINRRSEIMGLMNMTKEEADAYLKQNFREQYTKEESLDIARMNKPFNEMLSVFKELQKTLMGTPQNTGMMKNMLNNMLIKDGNRTFDEIISIMNILASHPEYRMDYKPGGIYKALGYLSNLVVGNDGGEIDGQTMAKGADPNLFKILKASDRLKKQLTDVINDLKSGMYDKREEEEEKHNTLVDIDSVLEGEDKGLIPIPSLTTTTAIMPTPEGDVEVKMEVLSEGEDIEGELVEMPEDEVLFMAVIEEILENEKKLVDSGKASADEYNKTLKELLDQTAPAAYSDKDVARIFNALKLGKKKTPPPLPPLPSELEEKKEGIFDSLEILQSELKNAKLRAIKKLARDFNRMVGVDSPHHIANIDNYKKADKDELKNILIEKYKNSRGLTLETKKPKNIFGSLPNKIKNCFKSNLTKKKAQNIKIIDEFNMSDINNNNFMDKITFLRKETRISNSTYQKVLNCINRGVITSMLQAGNITKDEGDKLRKDLAEISGNVADRVQTMEIMLRMLLSKPILTGSGDMEIFEKKKDKLKKKYMKKAEKAIEEEIKGKKKAPKKKEEFDVISRVDAILGMGEAVIGTGKKKASITCPKGHAVCTCKRKPTSWLEYVQKVRKEKNLSFKEALVEAKKTYKKM